MSRFPLFPCAHRQQLKAIRDLKVAEMYSFSQREVKINSSCVKIPKNKAAAWLNKSFNASFALLPTQQQMIHINSVKL